jgi:hypothetical protein
MLKLSEIALATLGQGWIQRQLRRRYRGNLNVRRDVLDAAG